MRIRTWPPDRRRHPSPHIPIVIFVVVACALALGLEIWSIWREREQAIAAGQIETSNLARSLAQHAHDTVQTAATATSAFRQWSEDRGIPQGTDRLLAHTAMATYVADLPMLAGIFLFDAEGNWVVNSNTASPARSLNNADRDYFRYHKTHADRGVHIDRPIRSKTDGRWVLPVSQRIDNPDGSFAGVVVAAISTDFFHRFYQTFNTGDGGVITLYSAAGIVIARNPQDEGIIGALLPPSSVTHRFDPALQTATLDYISSVDDVHRLGSFYRVPDNPLIVVVSHSWATMLADWWSDTLRFLTIGLVAMASLILLGARMIQQIRIRAEAERHYRLLADYSSDAIVCVTLSGQCLYISPSFTTLTGWSIEEGLTLPWGSIIHDDDRKRFDEGMSRLRTDVDEVTLTYRYRCKDGHALWVEARIRLIPESGQYVQFVANIRDISERKAAEGEVEALNRELISMAMTDGLTGLPNRRCFDERLAKEWARAAREGTELSLLMIDVDRFKLYNDRYGHQRGDDCLQAVAEALGSVIRRPGDMAARYGGEEMVVLLPNTGNIGANNMAERARLAVEALSLEHRDNEPWLVITASLGVATCVPSSPQADINMLLRRADAALYQAKEAGRNNVIEAGRPEASDLVRQAGI